jgi:transposase
MDLSTFFKRRISAMNKKYIVTLNQDERQLLEKLISNGKGAAGKLLRARILLKADASGGGPGWTDERIQEALDVGRLTICRVRQTFVEEGFEAALSRRRHRRYRPRRLDGDQEAHLIALACSSPPVGRRRWTLRLLADKMVELGHSQRVSPETLRQTLKNELKPHLVKMWCIPPEANAEFVWRMEDVLEVYKLPYDPRFPQVCMDESSKQLVGEVRRPLPAEPGRVRRIDNEYERKGVCNLFLFLEPLRGWRRVWVTGQRRKVEWAWCMKDLLEVHYPEAIKVRLVCDNLNTHTGGALYEAFPAPLAKKLCDRIEFHPTPKHGSWLNMAETELSVLAGQCLDRRMESQELVASEAAAWEAQRNLSEAKVRWRFTTEDARIKLEKLYPVFEAGA